MVPHGGNNLLESSNVAASHKRWKNALTGSDVFHGSVESVLEAGLHDVLEPAIDLSGGPGDTGRVLGHLQSRDGDTTGIGGLAGSVPAGGGALVGLAVRLEDVDGGLGAAHVGTFGDELTPSGNQALGFLARNFVLGGRWKSDVDLANVQPRAGTLDICELLVESVAVGDGRQLLALGLQLGDGVDFVGSVAVLAVGNERSLAVGQRDDISTKLDDLEGFILGDVAGARDGNTLSRKRLLSAGNILDHMINVVDNTIASSLGADQAAAPAVSLASEDTLPLVADSLVLAKEIADLEAGNTDITSRNVGVSANVLAELGHERLAEATDFAVTLALGIEVGTTLAAAHVHWNWSARHSSLPAVGLRIHTSSQSILEYLLETKELEDGEVDGGVEAQAALVRAKGGVELNTVTMVDLDLALVVFPDDAELDDALGNGDNRKSSLVLGVLLEESRFLKGRGKF